MQNYDVLETYKKTKKNWANKKKLENQKTLKSDKVAKM
jgi:hypothetical protein